MPRLFKSNGPPSTTGRYVSQLEILSGRIADRARAGRMVRLTPKTAMQVAVALEAAALDSVTSAPRQSDFTFRVMDCSGAVPAPILYAQNASIALAAFEAAMSAYPDRRLVALWDGWVMRKSWKD